MRDDAKELPPLAWAPLVLVAAGCVILLLTVAGRYGFHRDELYFLEAGQHLAFGYVDQPPLTPLLARVQTTVFGSTPWAIRVAPALITGGSAVLAGLLAREFGGERRAQIWAAVVVGGAAFVLAVGHLLSTATLDFAFWLGLIVVAARLLRTRDPRWWLAYGALSGLALWNKHLPVMLTIALLIALMVARRWEIVSPRWLVMGGAAAALIAAPTLVWQATHGWPQLTMAAALAERTGAESRATLLPLQLVLLGPLVVPLTISGVRWMRSAGSSFVPLAWAYAAALVLTFAAGGRPYYPLPLAAALMVAGVVARARREDGPPARTGWVAAHVGIGAALALPWLPPTALAATPIPEVNDSLVETIGWEQLTQQVRAVVEALPAAERDTAILFAGSYGEAGALDHYGPALGLPEVFSGHNSYADWRRPRNDDATVVAVRLQPAQLAPYFRTCHHVADVTIDPDVDNEVQDAPIVVCRGLLTTWDDVWPHLRRLS